MVRPEHFELLSDVAHADNLIEGRLVRTIMVGGVSRQYVELADGVALTATQLSTGFPARDAVRLGWRREHTIVLPAREALH
ncbi:MAG: hypothetical protein K0Q43_1485 [Ramlibacter sp.]|jgi:hypothetical protein|nr:hypothetical protein [Ramlibacter sp.]